MPSPKPTKARLLALMKDDPSLVARLLMVAEPAPKQSAITSDYQAYTLLAPHLTGHTTERLVIAALNVRRVPIAVETLNTGTDGFCIVCPRQIYSWALRQGAHGAHAIIVGHNHPSEDPTPSAQDLDATRKLAAAGRALGVPLLDHIVVGGTSYTSLAALGTGGIL